MARQKRVLNVGGNNKAIAISPYFAGWEHVLLDIDPSGNPDICCDARTMQDLEPAQFDAVYCSHNLEHFYPHDALKVLRGFLHVLRDDGFAEIKVPDIGAVIKNAAQRDLDIEDTLYTANIGPIRVLDVIFGYQRQIEQTGVDFYAHKNGFTKKSLIRVLREVGFVKLIVMPGRVVELRVAAFKNKPTRAHSALIGFPEKLLAD